MNSHPLNWQQLATDIETARQARGLSLREVGRQTGVVSSGLVKLRRGGKLSADAVASLTTWLNSSAPDDETLADTIALCTGTDTAAAVDAALRYVTGRVEHWTQEALRDGIVMVYTEHQALRAYSAANELRHYLEASRAQQQARDPRQILLSAIRSRADDAAPPPAAPTSDAPQPPDGQDAPISAPQEAQSP